MRGQKCSNCGYYMEGVEAILNNALHVLGGVFGSSLAKSAVGTNTISNATSMPCPKCGLSKRWIREDE